MKSEGGGMPRKILVVDDETEIVSLLEEELKALGYDVLTALDGLTGLEMARKERPALMILDLMLPKMDGYRVCGLLKNDLRYAEIPIILFSARAQEEDLRLGVELGANAYITKPFEPQELLKKVHELVNP